jgi:hypothetical protein
MRTHPPTSSKPIVSRLHLSFPRVPSRLCAILLRHLLISAPLRHHHASSSCVRLSSISCAVPGIVSHRVLRYSAAMLLARATSLRRHRAPSRATAPPCFFPFSVAHCARNELARPSAPSRARHFFFFSVAHCARDELAQRALFIDIACDSASVLILFPAPQLPHPCVATGTADCCPNGRTASP